VKRIITSILFALIATGGWCTSPGFIDSLKRKVVRTDINDTLRTPLLLQLSYYLNDPVEALSYGREALQLANKIGWKEHEAYAWGYIGVNEARLGNHLKSIESLINSANLFRGLKMAHQEGYALVSIGLTFLNDGDYLNALKYYQQGYDLFVAHKDTLLLVNTIINIGELYRKTGNGDSAVYYYQMGVNALDGFKTGDQNRIHETYATLKGNMGMVHLEMGRIDSAKIELEEAVVFFTRNSDPYKLSVYQSELGKLYILQGDVVNGERLIKESLEIAQSAQLKEQIRDFSLQLSGFYEKIGNSPKALSYFKHYKSYDDSLKNVETVRKMEQQQSSFELTKKEEKIAALNRINRLQKLLALALSSGILIFVIFIFVLAKVNRKIKKNNRLISIQKLLVEKRESEKALLLKELNHRVKNNLQMVASLLNLHARQLKGHPAAEALMAGRYRVEALTLIHQKLYRDDVDTIIDIKEYIVELTQNLVMNFGPDFHLELKLEPFIMKIDKAIPLGLIINELVTNSLKYGSKNNTAPSLRVSIENQTDTMLLTIADNGSGLPVDFDFNKAGSFGLKLVNSLVKQLDGTIECKSDKGTCWVLILNKEKIG
jgi:two-component system, sensor histidine kinase PdtaS